MEQAWLDLEAGRVREDERARDLERERQEKGRTESRRQRQGHRRQGCGDRDAEESPRRRKGHQGHRQPQPFRKPKPQGPDYDSMMPWSATALC